MEIDFHDEDEFSKWIRALGPVELAHVMRRLDLQAASAFPVDMPNGRRIDFRLFELRSPRGHRVYYTVQDQRAIVVAFGNKTTQRRDIEMARTRLG